MLLSLATAVVMAVLNVDNQGEFYEGVVQRRLSRQRVELPPNPTRGLVMLEIDGLSYHHMRRALAEGYMPNVPKLISQRGYVLSPTDCGLPSQTSACQAGILFGDNYDIPAFRWYDKAQGRLIVSSKHAAEINGRYANGNGLLRGGASVNNMVNGDATVSLLTASDLRGGTPEQKRDRARDVYTLLLDPNFFMRVIGLVVGEALLISLAGVLVSTFVEIGYNGLGSLLLGSLIRYGMWFLGVAVMQAAGRILRGQGTFGQTFRVMGFIQVISLISLLQLIPGLETPVTVAANLLSFFAVWMGAAAAQKLSGWRTVLLPLLFFATLILGLLALGSLLGGFGFALDSLLSRLGIAP